IFCLLFPTLMPALPAAAYPVLLNSTQLGGIFGTTRRNLIAVKSDGTSVQRIALQIDEVEDDAALVLRQPYEVRKIRNNLAHPQSNDPFQGRIQNVHRAVLDDRDFAPCNTDCQKKLNGQVKSVCNSPSPVTLLKITLEESQKNAFIVDCGTSANDFSPRNIKYDPATRKVSTPKYDYIHESEKNIFFSEIRNKSETKPVLNGSELKAYLKPKYLFNMKFQDDDLVSQITSLSRGPQSLNMEVAIALNILAMKINSQICCDVSFYEDALYFPVVLDLPFDGNSFAKGSGVFFGFQTEKDSGVKTEFLAAQSATDSDAILIQQGKKLITLGFRNPSQKNQTLVRPRVVTNQDMSAIKFMPVQSPSGIFYDIQNAKEGFQHFMVWMMFGDESERAKLVEYAQRGAQARVERFTNPDER
ncbi:hypothetical protein EBR21_04320, partial [bacterium]|nr:hypothetical protein [bacterium]